MLYISLSTYLRKLRDKGQNPPSITALAADIGMHKGSLNRFANNKVKQVNLDTADKILNAMRARGFNMTVSDLLTYEPEIKKTVKITANTA